MLSSALQRKPVTMKPARPNLGLEAAYKRQLEKLIEEMKASVLWWVTAAYRGNEPKVTAIMASDRSPAMALRILMRRLTRRWQARFDDEAEALARRFVERTFGHTDQIMRRSFKDLGMTVKFTRSAAVHDALQAAVAENASLIRSIPQRYMTDIEGAVMRSVQAGRDLESLTHAIMKTGAVTKRRAATIARDQNNKATAIVTRVRQAEAGITEAVWVHSGGGKVPRPTHLKAGREKTRYKISEGWYDPHEKKKVFPGELINCRCVSRSVIPGVTR